MLFFSGDWMMVDCEDLPRLETLRGSIHSTVLALPPSSETHFAVIHLDRDTQLGCVELFASALSLPEIFAAACRTPWQPQGSREHSRLELQTLSGPLLCYDHGRAWRDGKELDLHSPAPLVNSPYVQSAWDSAHLSLHFQGEELVLHPPETSSSWGPGLQACYTPADTTRPITERLDATLDYFWGSTPSDPAVPPGPFHVRWHGYFVAPYTGKTSFQIRCQGGLRFKFNHQLLLDHPASEFTGEPRELECSLSLERGHAYPLEIDYQHQSGPACLIARFATPHEGFQALGLQGDLHPHLPVA
ncbi:MAG: hypothetical protein HC904_08510 [Blastochloris sp.]|nr:hypothetical protein [Blastochloris sp.]